VTENCPGQEPPTDGLSRLPLLLLSPQQVLLSDRSTRRARRDGLEYDTIIGFVALLLRTLATTAMTESADSALQRFVDAQDHDGAFGRALAELRAGRKQTHWMWFVFPQLAGLGRSSTARYFAIGSLVEAQAYLHHDVLGPRLRECARALTRLHTTSAEAVLGPVDAQKLRSSMTLFLRADPTEPMFQEVLDQYFGGEPDPLTDALLGTQ
jgi:uncharacterized protein (DUF1810 family)